MLKKIKTHLNFRISLLSFVEGATWTSLQRLFSLIPFVLLLTTKAHIYRYLYFSNLALSRNKNNPELIRKVWIKLSY